MNLAPRKRKKKMQKLHAPPFNVRLFALMFCEIYNADTKYRELCAWMDTTKIEDVALHSQTH